MRLFIAVDFSELGSYFAELQKLLPKNARMSLAKSFHLTLKFLGEVRPEKVNEVIELLKTVKFKPFPAFLNGIGIFPTENYIRVVWVGLNPEDKILEMQKRIDDALKFLFKKEKDFKAHVTLARVNYPEDKKKFLEELRKIKIESKKIEIKEFRLIKSMLTPKGHVYEDLSVFGV